MGDSPCCPAGLELLVGKSDLQFAGHLAANRLQTCGSRIHAYLFEAGLASEQADDLRANTWLIASPRAFQPG